MNGLIVPLLGMLAIQIIVAICLIVPLRPTRKFCSAVYLYIRNGPGFYVASTLLLILFVLLGSSIGEIYTSQKSHGTATESDNQSMLLAVTTVKAQFSSMLCGINILLAILNTRFANEINDHDKLKLSHEALQKQALGLTNEYNRATDKGAKQELREDGDHDLQQRVTDLEEELKAAREDKVNAEKLVSDIKMQSKNLEEAYDTLMREHSKLQIATRDGLSDKKGQ